ARITFACFIYTSPFASPEMYGDTWTVPRVALDCRGGQSLVEEMGKDSRDASGYVRPAWEDVMREVNARPLNRDKVAFLREVVEQDDAFVRRHGVDDAESLRKKMSEAYVRGQLRASQVPSWADRGAGVGDNSTRRPTLPHVGVEDLP